MLNFDFSNEDLGLVSPHRCVHFLSRKMVLMLYSINWPNFIVWLPYFLRYLAIYVFVIVCYPICDVMNFEIYLSFSSSRFPTWPKLQNKNWNISRTKRAFKVKWKVFFMIFKGLSVARNCLRSENPPLRISFWLVFLL